MKSPLLAVLACSLGAGAVLDAPPPPVDIKEWPVPWERTRPRDPYVAPDGRIWFVGQTGDYLAYLVPASGEFKRYELDRGTGPHNLIVDRQGMVWYAGNRAAHIGKLDPRDGTITKYPMPDPAARDPHTLVFDSQGDIWFTMQGANRVGKLTVATGAVRIIQVPTPRARPYGIEVDSNDRPWIVLVGTNKIATVDPATMQLREIELPRAGTRPRRVAITSDDNIWYVDYAEGYVGRYDPASGKVDEWRAPSAAQSRPYAMASDDRDRIWFVETGPEPNTLVGFDPKTAQFFSETAVPSGAGTVRHMVFHAPSRAIWFGTDANSIGRALVP
ncbi:MAG: virginiamycin B lyase family protein [Gemmatimonadales bacterium]